MLTAIWGLCSMIPLFLMILKTPILRLRCLWCSEPLKTNFEKKKKQAGIKSIENMWSRARQQYVCVLNKLGRSQWLDTGARWSESFAPISLCQALR